MENNTPKVLVIGLTWPEPEATGAGVRTLQLLNLLQSLNYNVTLSSAAAKTQYSASLEQCGIDCVPIKLNCDSFDQFIAELKPHIVVFDRFLTEEYFGWRVAEQLPDTIRILDTQDLHSLRKSRELALKKGIAFTSDFWQVQEITLREIASIYRCDLSLIISEYEMAWLKANSRIDLSLLFYLPFVYNSSGSDHVLTAPDYELRSHFCFIGNGKHAPNIDAINYLKRDIWPKIRRALPNAKLNIYGAYLPKNILDLYQPEEGFFVKGWVNDMGEILQKTRVNLLPLRFGAGLKGKLFQSVRYGTPSVMTVTGAEGTAFVTNKDLVASDAIDFSEKAVRLYKDKEQWNTAQENGIKLIKDEFGVEIYRPLFKAALQDLQKNLQSHRITNFTGRMLLHHTMGSSKYLSKWITLKQRNARGEADE
ncbi:glycosyltransferase [Muriicola soli]|uniref:Glycosyltransferase n=1 Tax=Muriicola soli TaxID=2507538 RepID=A0A411E8Y8_9FLAO|nr:glycosyltransferase family 4 protein [Muriicola soli]QBA64181.1 glycosyltransferase [Muriicola soli]